MQSAPFFIEFNSTDRNNILRVDRQPGPTPGPRTTFKHEFHILRLFINFYRPHYVRIGSMSSHEIDEDFFISNFYDVNSSNILCQIKCVRCKCQ